jgi:hypothetical protein
MWVANEWIFDLRDDDDIGRHELAVLMRVEAGD